MSSRLPERNFYTALEVTPGASASEIKDSYRRMVRQHHPDANPDRREQCELRMKEIIEAYTTLSDPQRRERYDAGLRLQDWEFKVSASQPGTPTPSSHSAPSNVSLLARVRSALELSPQEFAARLGLTEDVLSEMELRDDMPRTPIQLRTFSQFCETAARKLEADGRGSFAQDIRTHLNRKKTQRAFFR